MNDNIDQQVKFKSTSQEVYDHLAEKDPNSLYFAEDSQRIYKGDTKFSDGSVDEDKFIKVYELSEHEFWDKFSSGDLQIGQYIYPQLGFVADDLPTRVMYGGSSGVVSTNNMYYIMSYWKDYSRTGETYRGGIVTQASHDFGEIKSFKLRDMITDREPSLLGREYLADNCIGCDDSGYLYMSVDEANIPNDGNPYKYGVVGVNTSQIDDDAGWSVLDRFGGQYDMDDECRMSFRPFNLITSYASNKYFPLDYNPAPTMYRDPLLTTKEGGLFGIIFTNNYDYQYVRDGCRIFIPYDDAYRIRYYKSGKCKHFESPSGRSYTETCTGPRCFTTNPDTDNKLYYLAEPYADRNYNRNIMVHSIDADGTYQCYSVVIDDSTNHGFTSEEAEYASFIRCKNNKIFVFIGNTNPVCAVLDLTTGEYSNIHKFTDFTFDAEKDYSTVSNIVEGDNSICFTIFNGEICQYVCWNYTEDRIYSVGKRVASKGYNRFEYNSSCDVLREGQSNSIIAYSSNFDDRTVKIQTLSCDDLSVLNTWTLDNAQEIDHGFAFAPIYELPDNKFLVLSYTGEPSSSRLAPAIIDETGNIEYCSATNAGYLGLSSDFNRSVILPSSRKDIYLIMSMSCSSINSYITLIDTKNMSFARCDKFNASSESCRPLAIDDNLLSTSYGWSGNGPSSSILSLGQGIVHTMNLRQKIQIINQGDITT